MVMQGGKDLLALHFFMCVSGGKVDALTLHPPYIIGTLLIHYFMTTWPFLQ
jgi:hypothetical protein